METCHVILSYINVTYNADTLKQSTAVRHTVGQTDRQTDRQTGRATDLTIRELLYNLQCCFRNAIISRRHCFEEFRDVTKLRHLIEHRGLGSEEGHYTGRHHL